MTFNIIRHRGNPKKATLPNGKVVERSESVLVLEWSRFVLCAPYDDHFVYEHKVPNVPSYMCTCGSAAVFVNYEDPAKAMLVCLHHGLNGVHQTGGRKWS